MRIVKFQISDLEDMMLFLDDNLTENYQKRVFHNIHQRWPEGFLLVKEEEKIVGVGCGAIMPNEKLRILILAMDENHQGRGFGKKLMDIMIDESRVHDVKKVSLEVRKDSEAISFYRKFGFSGVDVLTCYYQDGCYGIVMELQL